MSAIDRKKVSVGKPNVTGAVFAAPSGTAIPKDATTKLDPKFKPLGYVSEDGLTNSVSTDSEDIKAWGGDTVLTVQTGRTETLSCTLIQALDEDVLKEVYGDDNVTTSSGGAIAIKHNGAPLPQRVWVFEMNLTGGKVKRLVAPAATITEVGDIAYKGGEAIGYEVTITAFPDEAGNTVYEYIASKTGTVSTVSSS